MSLLNFTQSLFFTDFFAVNQLTTVGEAVPLLGQRQHSLLVLMEDGNPVGVCDAGKLLSQLENPNAPVAFSKAFCVLKEGQTVTENLLVSDYFLILDEQGAPIGWMDKSSAENDYLRRHLSEDVRELAMDLEAIVDSVYDEILVVNTEGTILRVSMRSGHNLWGILPSKIAGMNILELEEKGWFKPTVTRRVLEEKKKVSMIQKNRFDRTILAVGNPVFNRRGDLERIVIASRDVTELSQLQDALAEAKRQTAKYKQEIATLRNSQRVADKAIVYRSAVMQNLMHHVQRIAGVESTVVIYGESGVGKELVVHAIHHFSPRADKPFLKINCSSIPEQLLESELFGYVRGAFTGALDKGKKGLFELASGGTLFLDEIAELPLNLQVKLLRAIQEREIMKVGGGQAVKVDVRLVAATNRNLEQMVEEGKFREDLYYRLHVIPLYVPPLRDRLDDIEPLVYHYLQYFNTKFSANKHFSEDAMEMLNCYPWPGNVRQLQNIIERAIVVTADGLITANDLKPLLERRPQSVPAVQVNAIIPLHQAIELTEQQLIHMALARYKTTTKAAQVLETSQPTISRKLRRDW